MNAILVQYLVSLYFLLVTVPSLFDRPVSVKVLIQFGLALALLILSYLKISLIG